MRPDAKKPHVTTQSASQFLAGPTKMQVEYLAGQNNQSKSARERTPLDSVPPALLRATFSLTIRLLQYLDRGHLPRGIKNALGILLSSAASIALFVLAAATLLSPQKVLVSFRTSGAPKDFAIEPSAGT